MNKIKNTKKIYDDIEISEQLKSTVNSAIKSAPYPYKKRFSFKPLTYSLVSIASLYILILNTSPAFAQTVSTIPVLNVVSKIFTVESYKESDPSKIVNVKVPALANTGNTVLENKINSEIQNKIDLIVEEAKKRAEKYYHDYIAAGNQASSFLPVEIIIDYSIKSNSDKIVSFVITNFENHTSVFEEKNYYNLNLTTGETLHLKGLLGENYKEIIDGQIYNQIKKRTESDPQQLFFTDIGAFNGIKNNQHFYINENEKLVIVFDKYEIAPGYMGFPEFIIEAPITFQ